MTELEKAARQSLEALESPVSEDAPIYERVCDYERNIQKAITALRRALEQQPADQFRDATKMVSEPFGYFKAEPFGWTDCAETDEGAIALYERPQPAYRAVKTVHEGKPYYVADHVNEMPKNEHETIEELKRLRALVRAQQITIEKLEQQPAGERFDTHDLPGKARDTHSREQPAVQWVGLTDEELHKLWRESPFRGSGGQMDWFTEGARVAEAKLREKNNVPR